MAPQAPSHVRTLLLSEVVDPSVSAAHEREIRRAFERMTADWAAGDAAALASVWAPDCDHITLTRVRHVRRGRAMLQHAWAEAFSRRTPEYSRALRVTMTSIRLLSGFVAIVDGTLEYSAGCGVDGRHQPATVEPFTTVMQCCEDEWLIVASRVGPTVPAAKFVEISDDCAGRPGVPVDRK